MTNEEVLKALKGQHRAIDWLMAMLIDSERQRGAMDFMPSKSPIWPALVEGNRVIGLLESGEKVR